MLQRINTGLLLAILAAVVWLGFKGTNRQPTAGRFVAYGSGEIPTTILDTATGELHGWVSPPGDADKPGVAHINLATGRARWDLMSRSWSPKFTEAIKKSKK